MQPGFEPSRPPRALCPTEAGACFASRRVTRDGVYDRSVHWLAAYVSGEVVEVRVTREHRDQGFDRVHLNLMSACNLECTIVVRVGDHEVRTPSSNLSKMLLCHVDLKGDEPDLLVTLNLLP
jgi:hypothetical protein